MEKASYINHTEDKNNIMSETFNKLVKDISKIQNKFLETIPNYDYGIVNLLSDVYCVARLENISNIFKFSVFDEDENDSEVEEEIEVEVEPETILA